MMHWLHQLASPPYFYHTVSRWLPWLIILSVVTILVAAIWGLGFSPADYQQGEGVRILYVHVPTAWMSLFVYTVMAATALVAYVWRIKLAEVMLIANAYIGASFTFLALITGAIWGKPMWGTWWEWDARLTFELILLFQYLGVIALYNAIEDKRIAVQASSILAMVGIVAVPIIHFSVNWWATLHQGPSVSRLDTPAIEITMLLPLLVMFIGFKLFYLTVLLLRSRHEVLLREQRSRWVNELLNKRN